MQCNPCRLQVCFATPGKGSLVGPFDWKDLPRCLLAVHDAVNAIVLPVIVALTFAGLFYVIDPATVTHAMLLYTLSDFVWVALQVGWLGQA